MNPPLNLPTAPPFALWEELAEEAQRYLQLLDTLKATFVDAPERDGLEQEMMASLSHLATHASVMDTSVTDACFLADDLDEHEVRS